MSSLANTLLDSISAAALLGPKIDIPAFSNSSTTPIASPVSGPTNVRSIDFANPALTSCSTSVGAMGRFVARSTVPPFPGATNKESQYELCRIFHAKACSRLPEPISKMFTVANHLPALKIGKPQVLGNFVSINIEVRTQSSDVYQLEYSVDGIVWSIIHPIDGLADSKNETYELKLEGLSQARNSLLVRVVDSVGNLTTSRAEIKLP